MKYNFDFACGILLFITCASTLIGFLIRALFLGRLSNAKVAQQGGSFKITHLLFELGYWALQPLKRGLIAFKMTPNQISLLSLFFGFIAAIGAGFGLFGVAALMLTISGLLDVLDGMVARDSESESKAGGLLDAMIDRYNEFLFLGGLTIYFQGQIFVQLLAFLALMGSMMVSYTSAKAEFMNVIVPRGNMRRTERVFYLAVGSLFTSLLSVGEYPLFLALMIVAVGSNFSSIYRIVFIFRSTR